MAELTITLPDGRTLQKTLRGGSQVVGRDQACDIPLDDPSASRRHARFTLVPEGYLIEDMGSKNGTLVNDLPSASRLLKSGDRVQVGSTVLLYTELEGSTGGSVFIADEPTASHATRYIGKDQQLLLSRRRLEMIYALSDRLTTLQSQESLLENAMDICFETLEFERGALGVRRKNSRVLDWPVVRNLKSPDGGLTISRTLLNRALEHGERAIFTDDGTFGSDPTVSMVQQGIRSAMCVPLTNQDDILGIIYGDRLSTATPYTHEDIDFFAGIARQISIGLVNCSLMESQEQMVRLHQEIDFARRIQTGLFPATLPDGERITMAALNEPGQRVSGDYYDVLPCAGKGWWCLVADVTGEGIAAALLMANLQAAVRVTTRETDDPAALLAQWNGLICRNTDAATFITCLLAVVDPGERRLCFASAGHHAPMRFKAESQCVEELTTEAGFPLGVMDDASYTNSTVELGSDPVSIFLYTDGVIEAMNDAHEQFGKDRLTEVLAENHSAKPEPLIKRVRKNISRFVGGAGQSDDITMLAVRL